MAARFFMKSGEIPESDHPVMLCDAGQREIYD
jgi:hypothetical protein